MVTSSLSKKIALTVLPLLYIYGLIFGSFIGGIWATLGIGGALLLAISFSIAERRFPKVTLLPITPLFIFFGGVAVLNFFAFSQKTSWHYYLQELSIIIPLSLLFLPDLRKNNFSPEALELISAAAILGAAALGIEFLLEMPLLRHLKSASEGAAFYNRGTSYLAIMFMPVFAFMWLSKKRRECFLFLLLIIVPLYFTESRATKLAFIGGWAAVILAYYLPRLMLILVSLVLISLIVWPFAITSLFLNHHELVTHLPASWWARVEIWDYMSYRLFERPLIGWGLGASKLLPFEIPHGASYHYVLYRASHPHNAILQVWVELGIFGLLFLYSSAFYVLYRISRMAKPLMPFAVGTFVAAVIISLVAYSFWDDSLFALFAFCLILYSHLNERLT